MVYAVSGASGTACCRISVLDRVLLTGARRFLPSFCKAKPRLVEFQLLACFMVSAALEVCSEGEAEARSGSMPALFSFLLRCMLKTEIGNLPKVDAQSCSTLLNQVVCVPVTA